MLTEQDLVDKGLRATIVRHPLVQHKLTLMRRKEQSSSAFRALLREISWLLCFEVTRDLPLESIPVCPAFKTLIQIPKRRLQELVRAPEHLVEQQLGLAFHYLES